MMNTLLFFAFGCVKSHIRGSIHTEFDQKAAAVRIEGLGSEVQVQHYENGQFEIEVKREHIAKVIFIKDGYYPIQRSLLCNKRICEIEDINFDPIDLEVPYEPSLLNSLLDDGEEELKK